MTGVLFEAVLLFTVAAAAPVCERGKRKLRWVFEEDHMMGGGFLGIIGIILIILITVAISRWVFRIDEIVKNLKQIVSLLEALDKKTN